MTERFTEFNDVHLIMVQMHTEFADSVLYFSVLTVSISLLTQWDFETSWSLHDGTISAGQISYKF